MSKKESPYPKLQFPLLDGPQLTCEGWAADDESTPSFDVLTRQTRNGELIRILPGNMSKLGQPIRANLDQIDVLVQGFVDGKNGKVKPPSGNKIHKHSRNRPSGTAEMLLSLFLSDWQNRGKNYTELANLLARKIDGKLVKPSVSTISRAFNHKDLGPKLKDMVAEYRLNPNRIEET